VEIIKPLKLNHLALLVDAGLEKKGDSNLKVSLQKLLKTKLEKLSAFRSEQMFMKTNELKISSEYVAEK